MAISNDYLLDGLIKWNYFPTQKEEREDIPPIVTSKDVTTKVAREIYQLPPMRPPICFDSVQYQSTRFSNVPRYLNIPHPKPYFDLCMELFTHWDKLDHICSNENSLIIPKEHPDGRIVIMDYENPEVKRTRFYEYAFGKKFIVDADISNCYPSIYTHVLPWALVGKKEAKAKTTHEYQDLWFNILDKKYRSCCRNETAGCPVGPATSNIACELILEKIDKKLREDFKYIRFIDDYTAFCDDYTKAEKFIHDLSSLLAEYKLTLNPKKTQIRSLPQPVEDEWVNKIRQITTKDGELNPSQVSNIIDAAVFLQEKNPDGSVLKYAINTISKKLDDECSKEFLKYAVRLCFYYPILIPTIKKHLEDRYNDKTIDYKDDLLVLLKESVKLKRSDSMAWILYYLKKFHNDIPENIADEVINSNDCISISLLAEFPSKSIQENIITFLNNIDHEYLHDLDNYWVLIYQLYYKGLIENPYKDDATFAVLKSNNVNFIQF